MMNNKHKCTRTNEATTNLWQRQQHTIQRKATTFITMFCHHCTYSGCDGASVCVWSPQACCDYKHWFLQCVWLPLPRTSGAKTKPHFQAQFPHLLTTCNSMRPSTCATHSSQRVNSPSGTIWSHRHHFALTLRLNC